MWKFAIILNKTGFLNKTDLSTMDFFKKDFVENLKPSYDNNGVMFFLEDVNCPKVDSMHKVLNDNGFENQIVSTVKWKEFVDRTTLNSVD